MKRSSKKRPIWRYLLIAFALFAILGFTSSAVMFSNWSKIRSVTSTEANTAFDEVLEELEDKRKYIEISDSGKVSVQRELEADEPSRLAALHVLAYDPGSDRLVHTRFPFWFVRLKLTKYTNLGTMVTILAKDWENLNLDVTEHSLMHRGPGLVLEHERSNGARIILWSEGR